MGQVSDELAARTQMNVQNALSTDVLADVLRTRELMTVYR